MICRNNAIHGSINQLLVGEMYQRVGPITKEDQSEIDKAISEFKFFILNPKTVDETRFSTLPNEVKNEIFNYLNIKDLTVCCHVSKHFLKIATPILFQKYFESKGWISSFAKFETEYAVNHKGSLTQLNKQFLSMYVAQKSKENREKIMHYLQKIKCMENAETWKKVKKLALKETLDSDIPLPRAIHFDLQLSSSLLVEEPKKQSKIKEKFKSFFTKKDK